MSKEILLKKLQQIQSLLTELEAILKRPFLEIQRDSNLLHAAERKFLLIVESASEINATLILDKTGKTPDSYRRSFSDLKKIGILSGKTLEVLADSAKLRNILAHEYDFEEDYEKFYHSAKIIIPAYEKYLEAVLKYLK